MDKIYLDHASCTPTHPSVVEAMVDSIKNCYGNPSNLHHFGQTANKVVQTARGEVASLIGAKAEEIIFTSSGSEANNFAIKGLAMANQKKGRHIITSEIEHFSVLNPLKRLEKTGFEVSIAEDGKSGLEKLMSKHVMIVGLGGVGGAVPVGDGECDGVAGAVAAVVGRGHRHQAVGEAGADRAVHDLLRQSALELCCRDRTAGLAQHSLNHKNRI